MGNLKSHSKYSQFRFVVWLKIIGFNTCPVHISSKEHLYALQLREAIFRTVRSFILPYSPSSHDFNLINESARFPVAVPQLRIDTHLVNWETSDPVKACLSAIARDAILITSHTERSRLKMCNDNGCQMLFRDISPNNRRRWCSMSICGNRMKVSLHRQGKNR